MLISIMYGLYKVMDVSDSDKKECFSSKFDIKKEAELKKLLEKDGFEFKSVNYAFWGAKGRDVAVTLYKSGKILVQGKGTDNFISEYLGINNNSTKTSDKNTSQTSLFTQDNSINQGAAALGYSCWIGTDESGKGDYFGPLIIAGVMVNEESIKKLQALGIKDSKKMKDDYIEKVSNNIKACTAFSVITINPAKYNQLYAKFKNLNNLLAWGHARAIENILEKNDCKYAISDKFGNESLIKNALLTHGKTITLEQRVRAEEDIAVAAASVLARCEFVQRMKKMSREYGIDFQKGASEKVKEQAKFFIQKNGFEALSNIAKLHFKTTQEVHPGGQKKVLI